MRDRVDETIVLLVAANLSQQKNSVKHEAGRNGTEENYAQKNFDPLAPVEDDPAKTHGHSHARQANAQNQKRDRSFAPASDAHGTILPRRRSKSRQSVTDGLESDTNSVVVIDGMTVGT